MKRLALLTLLVGGVALCIAPRARRLADAWLPHDVHLAAEREPVFDPEAADSIRSARRALDASVWADEILAQEHEDTFVRLWDALRGNDAAADVLSDFAFETLQVAGFGAPRPRAGNVRSRTQHGASRLVTPATWRTWVHRWAADGYELEQCEFHHESFARTGTSFVSVFAVRLHVRQRDGRRFVLRGPLRVSWRAAPDAFGRRVPRHVDARDLTLHERVGPPAFSTVDVLEPVPAGGDVQPILVRDLDGDGASEIVLVGANTVYWNRGAWRFEAARLCREPLPQPRAALLGDFDGDTYPDLLVAARNDVPRIYRGGAHGTFETPPQAIADCAPLRHPQAITSGDIDADGDLDLWIAQYKPPYVGGQMPTPYYDAKDGEPAYLFVNHGNLTFEDATYAAGLAHKRGRRTYASSFVDLDDDGDLDLWVTSDFAGVDVYANDGHGRFLDVTHRDLDATEVFGMSHTIADFDDDATLDVFVTGVSSTTARRLDRMQAGRAGFDTHQAFRSRMGFGNRLYLGSGTGRYQEAFFDDLTRTGWAWAASAFDLENDGDLDLYVSNGHQSGATARDYCTRFWCHDIYAASSDEDARLASFFSETGMQRVTSGTSWNGFEHNRLLLNGDEGFVDVGYLMGVAFEFDSRAVVAEDLDSDGRVDLVLVQAEALDPRQPPGERVHVLRNEWPERRNWIGVRLSGRRAGGSVGAHLVVHTGQGRRVARVLNGGAFRAQCSNRVHFGLGQVTRVSRIEVRWPDGNLTRLDNPAINRYHTVE